ncbi:MAG: surface glycoprotein (TIGR04207 family)/PGF-CTERM protein [Natronomonas sp.]|jgi:surface glycoprotein (TIGR04207 family)/PGF-CTERM protein
MRYRAVLLSALLVVSLVGAAAAPAAAQSAEGEAYAGTHVEFDQQSNAVADYAVNGNVIVENVTMQAASETGGDGGLGVDAGLGSTLAADIAGATIDSRTEASASVTLGFESGGEMQAHDTQRGVVQFSAEGEEQVVAVNVSNDAEAQAESDKHVVVSKDDGSEGAFIVVGEGNVTVDDNGDVTAQVGENGELVYRQYDEERSESDEEAERMIQNGTATAEVYVQQSAESGQETAVEAIEYGEDTSVEVASSAENEVNMTVERTESEGKVVLTTVSEEAFENAGDIEVYVDGNAAAQADSYSAVEQSAMEGDEPRYYVSQSSSAEGSVDVAIGIDHFSARNVQMTSEDESTATEDGSTEESTDGSPDESTDGDGAGFGALAALAALASALVAARRR